jgi:hypothetical protein
MSVPEDAKTALAYEALLLLNVVPLIVTTEPSAAMAPPYSARFNRKFESVTVRDEPAQE